MTPSEDPCGRTDEPPPHIDTHITGYRIEHGAPWNAVIARMELVSTLRTLGLENFANIGTAIHPRKGLMCIRHTQHTRDAMIFILNGLQLPTMGAITVDDTVRRDDSWRHDSPASEQTIEEVKIATEEMNAVQEEAGELVVV